jgi:hypothetical protein
MEAADFITDSCNTGLKHALDVFGVHLAGSPITIYPNPGLQVQSGIIAAVTMAEVQVRSAICQLPPQLLIPCRRKMPLS